MRTLNYKCAFFSVFASLILISAIHTNANAQSCDPQIEEAQKASATLAVQKELETVQAAHEPTPSVLQASCYDQFAQQAADKAGQVFSSTGIGASNLVGSVQSSLSLASGYVNDFTSNLTGGSFASIVPTNFGSLIPGLGGGGGLGGILGGGAGGGGGCNVMSQLSNVVRGQTALGTVFQNASDFANTAGSLVPGMPGIPLGDKQNLLTQATNAISGPGGVLQDLPGGFSFLGPNNSAAQTLINATSPGSCGSKTPTLSGLTNEDGTPVCSCTGGCICNASGGTPRCQASAL